MSAGEDIPAGPFSGVRVLELCTGQGGLSAGALLAQLGAEVSQVAADATHPVEQSFRIWADRDKLDTHLNVSEPGDGLSVARLVDAADVFLSDLPARQLGHFGLDGQRFSERNPSGIHVSMTWFGHRGRWMDLTGDPLLLAAVSGYADHYPATVDRPVAPVVPTFCYLHGALGATAAAAGLVGRSRDGAGRAVSVSGLDAMAAALGTLMVQAIDGDKVVSPGRSPKGAPYFRLYQAGDGAWLYLAALSPAIFFRALDAIGRMDVMVRDEVGGEFSNLLVPAVAEAVNRDLETTFAMRPASEWIEILRMANVPAAPVWSRETWLASSIASQVTPRVEVVHPLLGTVTSPACPISLSRSPVTEGAQPPPSRQEQPSWPRPQPEGRVGERSLPLAGLRVADAGAFLAAPFAGALLADFGADVIKVEPVDGDPYRVYSMSHTVANQHKRHVALDLRDDQARRAFLRLVGTCDVLVDNAQGGSLARLGLHEAVLADGNPGLVRCSVSAFGTDNPWSATPGFDPVLQSMTGLAVAQGGADSPAPSSAPVVDAATGALSALGILAALWARRSDGVGRHVRTSLAAAAVFVQSAEMTSYPGRPATLSGGPDFLGPAPNYRYYAAQDGWLGVAATTEAECRRLGELVFDGAATGSPSEAGPEEAFARRKVAEWVSLLAAAGVPAAEVLRRHDAMADPYLIANGFSHVVEVPSLGRYRLVRSYGAWTGSEPRVGRGADVGRDTVEVLTEVGLDAPEVAELLARGAARGSA